LSADTTSARFPDNFRRQCIMFQLFPGGGRIRHFVGTRVIKAGNDGNILNSK